MSSDPPARPTSAAPPATRPGDAPLEALSISPRERAARRGLAAATIVSAFGLAIAGTFDRTVGGVITIAGWVVLVVALHALGRAAAHTDPT